VPNSSPREVRLRPVRSKLAFRLKAILSAYNLGQQEIRDLGHRMSGRVMVRPDLPVIVRVAHALHNPADGPESAYWRDGWYRPDIQLTL